MALAGPQTLLREGARVHVCTFRSLPVQAQIGFGPGVAGASVANPTLSRVLAGGVGPVRAADGCSGRQLAGSVQRRGAIHVSSKSS